MMGFRFYFTLILIRDGDPFHSFFETYLGQRCFRMEWPPGSGKFTTCPEIDRACFFGLAEAKQKINAAQIAFLEELERLLRNS